MRERARLAARAFLSAWIPLLVVGLVLTTAACKRDTKTKTVTVTQTVTQTVVQTVTQTVTVVEKEGPFLDLWQGSAHADASAEAFNHWNGVGVVSTSCAKCHSGLGFQDWVGADGTAFEVVDNAPPIGSVIDCDACHNSGTWDLSTVLFPSGVRVDGLGAEARCMQCHQGRESTLDVEDAIAGIGEDTVDASLRFLNVHYKAAGATLYGREVMGGYQFPDKFYDGKFQHVSTLNACLECHDPHSLEVRVDRCGRCHEGVTDEADLHDIRMTGSVPDYDGDGDAEEGISGEIDTMAEVLYAALVDYTKNVVGQEIVYDEAYPYFYYAGTTDSYGSFTPRSLRAAYNYQYYLKDPGAFAHNAKYVIELLYDCIEDLVDGGANAPAFAGMTRTDSGHFDLTAEPFRHWDDDGEVSSSCARCHSAEGFLFYVEWGVDTTKPTHPTDGFNCEMCHVLDSSFATDPALKYVAEVTFPSDVTISNDENDPDPSFLCMTCHQGRESKATVDAAIVAGTFSFKNIHYLAAGPSLYGSDAGVGYEYSGKTYNGKWNHFESSPGGASKCVYCHLEDHTFLPQFRDSKQCKACHSQSEVDQIRLVLFQGGDQDWDGDGSKTEPMEDEVASYGAALWTAIRAYAPTVVYEEHSYPYFFNDTNGNGVADPNEANYGNRYTAWDAKLMKAAFNYQMWKKEPGAWAHNFRYIMQLTYDAIVDLGGSTGTLTRP